MQVVAGLLAVTLLTICALPASSGEPIDAAAGATDQHPGDVSQLVAAGIARGLSEFEAGFNGTWKQPHRLRYHGGGQALAHECERLVDAMQDLSKVGRQCISTHTV